MKIKLKDKYKKIKNKKNKKIGWKIPKFLSLLLIRAKRFNIFKNEKKTLLLFIWHKIEI